MKDYDGAQERIEKAVEEIMKRKPLFDLRKTHNFVDFYCRNCGRSVYVGKCCPSPDIHEMERPAPECLEFPTPEEMKGADEIEDLSDMISQSVNCIREELDREIISDIIRSLNAGDISDGQIVGSQLRDDKKVTVFLVEFDKLCNNLSEPDNTLKNLTRKEKDGNN